MDGQEGQERGSASKFQGSSRDGDRNRDGDRATQVHLPSSALFQVAFLSHPKPRVYPTLKAQFGVGALPLTHPDAPPCREPSSGRAGVLVPISVPAVLLCGTGDSAEALGMPLWGCGLVAGCPRARAVWHRIPGTRISSVPGLSCRHRHAPASQGAVPHRRRHGRFSSRRVRSVFVGKIATRREKFGRQAGPRLGRRDGCPPVAF